MPDLLTAGGLAGVLDVAATLGIGAVAVALLLIAGEFDFSIGAVAAVRACALECATTCSSQSLATASGARGGWMWISTSCSYVPPVPNGTR